MVGLQSQWTAQLLQVSTDGRRCKIKAVGWEGWVLSKAVLNMELP